MPKRCAFSDPRLRGGQESLVTHGHQVLYLFAMQSSRCIHDPCMSDLSFQVLHGVFKVQGVRVSRVRETRTSDQANELGTCALRIGLMLPAYDGPWFCAAVAGTSRMIFASTIA